MVQQYASTSTNDQSLPGLNANVLVRYVAMNSGSYAWLEGNRTTTITPLNNVTCAGQCDNTTIPTATYSFGAVSGASNCSGLFNTWPYGMDGRSADSYSNSATLATLAAVQSYFKPKNVTYVLGLGDICTNLTTCGCQDPIFDMTCQAMLQGNCRLQRGFAYYNSLTHIYGSQVQALVTVPGVGHDVCNMLLSPTVQSLLFTPLPPVASTTGVASTGSAVSTTASTPGASTTASTTTSTATAVAFSAILLFAAILSMF